MKQIGARFIRREMAKLKDNEIVCIQHVTRESDLIRVSANVVKRKGNK